MIFTYFLFFLLDLDLVLGFGFGFGFFAARFCVWLFGLLAFVRSSAGITLPRPPSVASSSFYVDVVRSGRIDVRFVRFRLRVPVDAVGRTELLFLFFRGDVVRAVHS